MNAHTLPDFTAVPCHGYADPVDDADAWHGRMGATADRQAQIHIALRNEFIDALADPARALIGTPGFLDKQQPAVEVVHDMLSDAGGMKQFAEMLRLLHALTLEHLDVRLVRMQAGALIATMAKQHATFHEVDACEGGES